MPNKTPFAALIILLLGAAVACAADDASPPPAADENNFHYQTKMTKEGLFFRVPEDMPIERRGGLQVPMQFDEYMYGKFKQLDAVLKDMSARLDRIEKMLTEIKEEQGRQKKLQS